MGMDDLVYVAIAVLFVVVIVEGLVLVGVMRQLGAVLLEVRPGSPRDVGGGPEPSAPLDVNGFDFEGGAVFVFLSPNCEGCETLRPVLADLPEQYPSVSIAAIVAFGSEEERRSYADSLGGIVRPELARLQEEWSIPGTPYAVSADASRRVRAKGIVTTPEQLAAMAEVAGRPPEDAGAADGNRAEEVVAVGSREERK
jgi:thiol-disulfide isomerase/thioredoxin